MYNLDYIKIKGLQLQPRMTVMLEKNPIGRPRKFDLDLALMKALDVFRDKGYEGTSITDLTNAIGINRPSLYKAFGTKEDIFRKAFSLYLSESLDYLEHSLTKPTSYQVVEFLLSETIEILILADGESKGCFAILSSLSEGLRDIGMQQEISKALSLYTIQLTDRFQKARDEGDIPSSIDPSQLARFISAIHKGLSVQASIGATRAELEAVVDYVLSNWPTRTCPGH